LVIRYITGIIVTDIINPF